MKIPKLFFFTVPNIPLESSPVSIEFGENTKISTRTYTSLAVLRLSSDVSDFRSRKATSTSFTKIIRPSTGTAIIMALNHVSVLTYDDDEIL